MEAASPLVGVRHALRAGGKHRRLHPRTSSAWAIPFFAYPIAAVLAHPQWGRVGKAMVAPHVHASSAYLLLFVATAGTTRSRPTCSSTSSPAVVERGARVEELAGEQREAVAGAVLANLVASFIIIATGATLFVHPVHSIDTAAEAARALRPFAGRYAEALFGIGLLGASLLASAILPIATSYVVSESLGFEKGLGRRPTEAPVFVGVISGMIAIATVVAVIPGIPVISLLIGAQVVNGLLLPVNLFFVWRLARNSELMGEHRNRALLDALTALTVAFTSALSLILVVVTIAGA